MSKLLLTGATGMIGGLLVDALVDRGVAFSVMVRPSTAVDSLAERPGLTVVRGDFDDPPSMVAALQGVDRAFLLTNSTERAEEQQKAFVDAASAAGVSHLVKLSQLHARPDSPVRFLRYHAAVESAIERAGLPFTFVRPNLILQAYLPFAPSIAAGVLQAPIGTAEVSVVDARDIAALTAATLTEDGHRGQIYDVTGPAAVSHSQIATAFGKAGGHQVRFETVPEEIFAATLKEAGMPPWQADGLVEDYAHYERGEAARVSPDVERVTGRPPHSVDDFARDHRSSFSG